MSCTLAMYSYIWDSLYVLSFSKNGQAAKHTKFKGSNYFGDMLSFNLFETL